MYGRVRALLDERGERLQQAGPSSPAVVTGLSGVAEAGDVFQVMANERSARSLAEERGFAAKQQQAQPVRRITLADLASQVAEGSVKALNVVVKAEANGSLEALRGQIEKIEDPNVKVVIVASGVGPVGEADVNLAAVTDSIVIGFNVRPDDRAKVAADTQGVDVRYYDVIYQIADDIEKAIKGLYEPTFVDVFQGRAEVRQVFTVDGRPAIAGLARRRRPHPAQLDLHCAARRQADGPQPHRRPQAVQGRRARGRPRLRLRHHPGGLQRLRRRRHPRGVHGRAAEPVSAASARRRGGAGT